MKYLVVVLNFSIILGVQLVSASFATAQDKDREFATPLMQKALQIAIQSYLDTDRARAFLDAENGIWARAEPGSFEPYASVEDFLETNPDCCYFSFRGKEGMLPTWLSRFRYRYMGMVLFDNYFTAIEGPDGELTRGPVVEIPINNDGEIIPELLYGE